MAEFCLECLNKISDTNFLKDEVELSKQTDLCDVCLRWINVVVKIKKKRKKNIFEKIFKKGI